MSADLVRRIHATSTPLVLAVTGGGSAAISALLQVPGASRTVLEAVVPYSAESLAAWLGSRPEHFCSERTARAMAMVAYQRAVRYVPQDQPQGPSPCGLGCTASLASDRPKHGPHRVHVALQTESATACHSLELVKGARDRRREEAIATALVLNLVAEACGLNRRATLKLLAGEDVVVTRIEAPPDWRDLLGGRAKIAAASASDTARQEPYAPRELAAARKRVVFPGAFNPRHEGHWGMARLAAERLGLPIEYEISIVNVDKPPLDFIEMRDRARQFAADESLWYTRAATFVEKSAIFFGATFIVGADTIARIAEPKYYGHEPKALDLAIDAIDAASCRFLVFGRRRDASFVSLADLALPSRLLEICDEIPAGLFRSDISSTELRRVVGAL